MDCQQLIAAFAKVADTRVSIYASTLSVLSTMNGQIADRPPQEPLTTWVVRDTIKTPTEAAAILNILLGYYGSTLFKDCGPLRGFTYPAARTRAMAAIGKYIVTSVGRTDPGALSSLGAVIFSILTDPRAGRDSRWDETTVAEAANIIIDHPTTGFDRVNWLPLWSWAQGGPTGNASVRTRVFAMKALQAILRRGALLPAEVRAANSQADVLRQQIATRAPNIPAAEKNFFLTEANSLVAAVSSAIAQLEAGTYASDGAVQVTNYDSAASQIDVTTKTALVLGGSVVFSAMLGGLVYVISRRRQAAT